jgi:dUTP pyrophosphatase
MIEVEIINQSAFELPAYATEGAAGLDIRANITEPIVLAPLERQLIATGLFVAIPLGYEIQIRPRSGLAFKHGITVLNTPGTIDADYRGEIKVLLVNLSNSPVTVEPGERVAQMVLAKHEVLSWKTTHELPSTERGAGGFGSTGIK